MRYPGKELSQSILSQKIIPNVNEEFAKMYHMPEGHKSAGILTADNDDVIYCALDDATKKSKIQVISAGTSYGGNACSWSKYGGAIFALISGPKVADVKSGMNYIQDYVRTHPFLYALDDEENLAYYVDLIPKAGKYYQELLQVPEGTSLAYLAGPPAESVYALDKALKAGPTKVVKFWAPPSRGNCGGAILAGTESACKSSLEAFVQAMTYCAMHPMDL